MRPERDFLLSPLDLNTIHIKMVDIKSNVSFSCQRCLQPLRLDASFDHLGEHTLAELSRR